MLNFIYNVFFILPAYLLVTIFKLFNKKLADRENNYNSSLLSLDNLDKSKKNIWFHAASMGEFEQAKPIIEFIKSNHSDYNILVSFFSPSGYNNQKNYKFADAIFYMPIDTKSNARIFIKKINPSIAIFVRYDLWRNHLLELKYNNIPTILICATKTNSKMLSSNFIFKQIYKSTLELVDELYSVNNDQYNFFISLSLSNKLMKSSDTRNDRIIQKVEESKENPLFPKSIFDRKKVIVAGSTWEKDEDILLQTYINLNVKHNIQLIIVPHEPTKEHIKTLSLKINEHVFLSEIDFSNSEKIKDTIENKIIIVDSIGKLLDLYANADIAYIGGGFGVGVHSVSEPAGYGIPVITGPKFENSPDANELFKLNLLLSIESEESLSKIIEKLLNDYEYYQEISKFNFEYVQKGKGESIKLANVILNKL